MPHTQELDFFFQQLIATSTPGGVETAFDQNGFTDSQPSLSNCVVQFHTMQSSLKCPLISLGQASFWVPASFPEGRPLKQPIPAGQSSWGHNDDMTSLESLQACGAMTLRSVATRGIGHGIVTGRTVSPHVGPSRPRNLASFPRVPGKVDSFFSHSSSQLLLPCSLNGKQTLVADLHWASNSGTLLGDSCPEPPGSFDGGQSFTKTVISLNRRGGTQERPEI